MKRRCATASTPWTATSDRKSTRLNSSHDQISYAVFCLKKKKTLVRILAKLAQALGTGMGKVLGKGRILAARASELAVKWGNVSAYSWRHEPGFCSAIGLGIVGLS